MRFIFLFFIFTFYGCSTPNINVPIIYKMEIQQGNEIDSEMLLKLKPGMTKSQVKFILGTPLIADSFHKDRWDYMYVLRTYDTVQKNLGFSERRHVVLNFENQLLKNIAGEVIPSEGNLDINKIENTKEYLVKPRSVNEIKEEGSWVEKIKFWESEDDRQIEQDNQTVNKPSKKDKDEYSQKKSLKNKEENNIPKEKIKEQSKATKTKEEVKNKEGRSWVDNIKFWESDNDEQTAPKNKKIQKEKERKKIKSETDNERISQPDNINDTKESVNQMIKKDISQEKDSLVRDENDADKLSESKQDIIESVSDKPDYFDLMLEKIGF